jgi:hypothetical protein
MTHSIHIEPRAVYTQYTCLALPSEDTNCCDNKTRVHTRGTSAVFQNWEERMCADTYLFIDGVIAPRHLL